MDTQTDATTLATLSSLEKRLQRLSFHLTGSTLDSLPNEDPENNALTALLKAAERSGASSAQYRVHALEQKLSRLSESSSTVRALLDLRKYTRLAILRILCLLA